MYFAWLGHYTTALSIPAVVGFLFWVSSKQVFTDKLKQKNFVFEAYNEMRNTLEMFRSDTERFNIVKLKNINFFNVEVFNMEILQYFFKNIFTQQ